MDLFKNIAFWSLIFGTSILAGPVSWLTLVPLTIMSLSIILEKSLIPKVLNLILSAAALIVQPALIIPMILVSVAMNGLKYFLGDWVLELGKSGLETLFGASSITFTQMAPALTVAAFTLTLLGGISFAILGTLGLGYLIKSLVTNFKQQPIDDSPQPEGHGKKSVDVSQMPAFAPLHRRSSYQTDGGQYSAVPAYSSATPVYPPPAQNEGVKSSSYGFYPLRDASRDESLAVYQSLQVGAQLGHPVKQHTAR